MGEECSHMPCSFSLMALFKDPTISVEEGFFLLTTLGVWDSTLSPKDLLRCSRSPCGSVKGEMEESSSRGQTGSQKSHF